MNMICRVDLFEVILVCFFNSVVIVLVMVILFVVLVLDVCV